MITQLNPKVSKFTHILHISDIHIRLNKRHSEFREVFNTLYEEVNRIPPDTLITFLGDLFHSKSDLSPECVQMASDFITNLANLRPLVIVAGNHDCTLSNKSRLDSLTPIIDALNNPNVFYLKTTGLYGFGNILFNNMCVFDAPERYIVGKDIPDIYRNQYEHIIALFHGAVDRASLDTGYSISNPSIMNPLFDWNDIALLGDIHKKQDMQDYDPDNHKPCIRYCGSLICQNHGEPLKGHGYSLWDLNTRTYTHHELKNDTGYFTVDIVKGQLTTNLKDLPKNVHLRVKCFESIASEVKAVIAQIKQLSNVVETAYVRMDQERDKTDIIPICKDIVLADLTNIDYQDRLITEFLTKKLQIVDPLKIEDILKINKATNALIKKDEFSRNLKWKPIRFEWDNMFTYGEGNVIDFTNMDGVYGVFGPNKSGKSSILSSIIFCLFDKFDRGFKGSYVLNVQKTSFKCKLEFEISGVHYFIERRGNTTRSGNVKVDVSFWRVVNGIEEELHGTARRDTNDIIRDYVGTYEDFILTVASFQNAKNSTSFIDMGNSERKDLLVQFIGLNVFDRLHESASERNKLLTAMLKLHKDKNYYAEIQQNQSALNHANVLFNTVNKELEGLQKQINDVNIEIAAESGNLIKLDDDVPINLVALEAKRKELNDAVTAKEEACNKYTVLLAEQEKLILDVNKQLVKIEASNLVESHKTYRELSEKITVVKTKMDLKRVEVKGKLEKVARLAKHEYDPNCKFCVNNDFVKDAIKVKTELLSDKKETDQMVTDLDSLREEFAKYQWVEKAYETYTKLLTNRSTIKDAASTASRNILIVTNELEKLTTSFQAAQQQIELYHRNVVAVKANEKVRAKIESYKVTLGRLNGDYTRKNSSAMDISGKRELFANQINTLTETIEKVKELENEFDSYQLYLTSVGRDGIPYQVICNAVPEIEKEVNSILSQVVDYTVQFETDGKNVIPYVVYDYGKWPIELTSGYERFVASVAIRVALIQVSNLPRSTFLATDEGYGTLDPDNLASMHNMFTMLKNYFDFVLVISHLEALKDAVDKTIEITHENGLAKVVYEPK